MDFPTIAAISTALGEGGIGIVRLSGKDSLAIANTLFRPHKGSNLLDTKTYRLRYGRVIEPASKQVVDHVLVAVMRGPQSYTGEDVVEFQCHGGIVVVQRILELVLAQGASLAEPGEFTKRAFLNGRIDLSQAEAVIDVIRSKTDLSLDLAVKQLEGSLSQRIEHLREKLYSLIIQIEAAIDFPEDDIPEVEQDVMEGVVRAIIADVNQLLATANDGKVLREGIKTVITGKPNVGKSSMLNRLLNENRALVTEIPGTTRDVIEEVLNLQGIPFRILDTAGIRETSDYVEQLGVKKSMELLAAADLVIHVLDISSPLSSEDYDILEKAKDKHRIIVINKLDLPAAWSRESLPVDQGTPIVELSLLEGDLVPLTDTMISLVQQGFVAQRLEGAIITRTRHKHALESGLEDLNQALATLVQKFPIDLVAVGLQGALEHLGEITGETVRDNMIDRIFAQFCIGK